ncbi:unnamed protein product [Adineta steineri]|uniref:Alpha-2-macroglobulin domain-containing protein n=1 Tax=Adineta steineri TaxID=433720 RepID=A0A814W3Y8_9BILA|nr:unnamed protein product [Adineta steineri]CAF1197100.1 unnamed protein product [Adineta steineri]
MNWSLIILGLVALSSVAFAKNSYLVIVPKLLKVDYENQLSIFIADAPKPVEVKFELVFGQKHLESKTICKSGETRNATLALPKEFPVGAAELIITATGGLTFEERRDIIVYDNRHMMLVQTSATVYRPSDMMEIRVIATTEEFMPIENGELKVEIYDGLLKLVGEFPRVPIRSGLTETLRFPIAEDVNAGKWLVSAVIANTTSSVDVLIVRPVTPSFDLKAIFSRFLLRTDKMLRGVIEMDCDDNTPIFGRAIVAVGPIMEQEMDSKMRMESSKEEKSKTEEWRKWKSLEFEIAGRVELNYDLLSLFNIDITKVIGIQVYIQVTDLMSGQERIVRHVIPVFARDIIYDIRPLEFEAGTENEFEIIAKRPDGKPVKMEDMIVHVRMILGDEHGKQKDEKIVEIKDFYTRGRNDMGFFHLTFPENCIGVLMTMTPISEDGKEHGYRTHTLPLMPTPRRTGAKLTIELLPSKVAPLNTDVNVPVISSQVSTVGRISNFYVQLMSSKPIEKFERLPMSYVLMTNGRITLTGEFFIEPTKECNSKTVRTIRPEEQTPPTCMFNGTLPIHITRDMIPYSTLLVYTFQPTFNFTVAESYRFAVAGLFQNPLTLNATIVPFTPTETIVNDFGYMKYMQMEPIRISSKAQDRSRVELSFTGVPESTVGLNVFEFDGILQGLSTEITKERLLRYLTTYEHVPLFTMPVEESMVRHERQVGDSPMAGPMPGQTGPMNGQTGPMNGQTGPMGVQGEMNMPGQMGMSRRTISEHDEEMEINRERMGYEMRYPIEKMMLGINTAHTLPTLEGDDIYISSDMGRLYGDMESQRPSSTHYRRKLEKSMNQYDVNVNDNDYIIATSIPLVFTADSKPMPSRKPEEKKNMDVEIDSKDETMYQKSSEYGTSTWYERMNTRLNSFTPEAFKFMHSGLTIVSDFDALRMPIEMKHENFTKLFRTFRDESTTFMERPSFNMRDEARELLERYMVESDLSMMVPPIMLEEQARTNYYRSIFFNTSRIESQGMGKVVLPQTKPYSTWVATGFALNDKTGLSIAQPLRLPTNRGLFVLGNLAKQARVNEHVLLSFGINNYLEKDLTNVILRIRASADFDLFEQSKPEEILSSKDKDYTFTMPLKSFAVETRHMVLIPKRAGLIQVIIEVESDFGGDYEILTMHVRESGIEHQRIVSRLFDLTSEKKSYGPIVEKIVDPSNLRAVRFSASSTFLDRYTYDAKFQIKPLVGMDRSLFHLYRALSLRRYLNETFQTESPLFNMTAENITVAYQQLQYYNDYDGSYSFIPEEGKNFSSLYYTSLAFGAMISPMMPFRDNVTLNRTLNWILSRQQQDGSFDCDGFCFHYRFCAGEYRRESLTAFVLYSLTRDNSSDYMPEFIRHRLFDGEMSPIMRAHRYLESRITEIKPHLLPISLFELTFLQSRFLSKELREKIHETLLSRKLTVVPEDNSKYLKNVDNKMTFDDELLVNAMTASLYAMYGDYKTTFDIARWLISQVEVHPQFDTILDGVFYFDAWFNIRTMFYKHFGIEKFDVTIDVSSDSGEKRQFKINSKNMDYSQMLHFTAPVRQITYSVKGFGLAMISIDEVYVQKEQTKAMGPMPFSFTQEFKPMSWFSEIMAKTCMTYTPTSEHQRFIKDTFNRTMVIEMHLPSGMRVNERQIGFFLSRVEQVMYFKYERCGHKLSLFINVPSTWYGKPICMEWCLERLSTVMSWSPMQVRVYDYLQPEMEFIQYFPMQFQPKVLGYSFVDAIHEHRPKLESLPLLQKSKQEM